MNFLNKKIPLTHTYTHFAHSTVYTCCVYSTSHRIGTLNLLFLSPQPRHARRRSGDLRSIGLMLCTAWLMLYIQNVHTQLMCRKPVNEGLVGFKRVS